MILLVAAVIFAIGALAFWFVIIRPILRARGFADAFFDKEETVWQSLCGYRTMLASYFVIFASVAVAAYDFIAPIAAGTDITPVTQLLPSWAWPLIWIAIGALFRWLRTITDRPEAPTAPVIG